MSFDPNIPASGQTLGGTRGQVQQNFSDTDTHFKVNHIAFNDSGAGKHNFMQMPEQPSAPTTAANEGALYTKANPLAGTSQTSLFFRQESSGAEIQMTTDSTPVIASEGQTFLPGGLLFKWGLETSASNGSSVTFSVAAGFTAFSAAPYCIQLTSRGTTQNDYIVKSTPTATGFVLQKITDGSQNSRVYWIAIGPA